MSVEKAQERIKDLISLIKKVDDLLSDEDKDNRRVVVATANIHGSDRKDFVRFKCSDASWFFELLKKHRLELLAELDGLNKLMDAANLIFANNK